MKELDEIVYDALTSNEQITSQVSVIRHTCIEVPPTEEDNTPLPYIIITDDSFQNEQNTKEDIWEGGTDRIQVSVEIAAGSPHEVKTLRTIIRKAIAEHVSSLPYCEIPQLLAVSNNGIAWDWIKPCYYDTIHYQASMENYLNEYEQD